MVHTVFQTGQIMPLNTQIIPTTKTLSSCQFISFRSPSLPKLVGAFPKGLIVKGSILSQPPAMADGDTIAHLERCFIESPPGTSSLATSSSSREFGPVMKGQYGAFGAVTLEKSKLDMTQKQTKVREMWMWDINDTELGRVDIPRDLLPLALRYKTWLIEGPHINRFDTLKHLAPNEADEDVLKVLQNYATLVQGLWVTKTSLLEVFWGPNYLAVAREYVLLLFRRNNLITYDQINAARSIGKFMTESLASLAIERPSLKDWKFKETTDVSFIKFHPEIVKVQDQIWEEAEKLIIQCIFKGRGEPALNSSGKPVLNSSGKPVHRSGVIKVPMINLRHTPAVVFSKYSASNEIIKVMPKVLYELFQKHKHCSSFPQICQRLCEMSVSKSRPPKGMADKEVDSELWEIIEQIAPKVMTEKEAAQCNLSELWAMIEEIAMAGGLYVPKSYYDSLNFHPLRVAGRDRHGNYIYYETDDSDSD